MPVRIDHVIVAAADLGALESAFTRLGFHVVGGGTHPHLGTRNQIILLDQGYIELLAIADEQTVDPKLRERIAKAPGWIGFALQSADIVAEAEEMRARGVDVRGPKPGRLVAPNGKARSWQTVTIGSDALFSAAEPLPFLIQHDSVGAEHQQELAGEDTVLPHPNGAQKLAGVSVACNDFDTSFKVFMNAYPLDVSDFIFRPYLMKAEAGVLLLPADKEAVSLAWPTIGKTPNKGVVAERLARAGEGVCCVSIQVSDLAATQRYLADASVTTFQTRNQVVLIPASEAGGAPLLFVATPQVKQKRR